MRFWVWLVLSTIAAAPGYCVQIEEPLDGPWYWRPSAPDDWRVVSHIQLLPCGSASCDVYLRAFFENDDPGQTTTGEFMTQFTLQDSMMGMDRFELGLGPLGCNASVFVNDSLLEVHSTVNGNILTITNVVHPGRNQLRIIPANACADDLHPDLISQARYTACVRAQRKRSLSHAQSDQPQRGFFPAPVLRGWRGAVFRNLSAELLRINEDRAEIDLHIDLEASRYFFGELSVKVDGRAVRSKMVELRFGSNPDLLHLVLDKPELWWPHDMGTPRLHDIEVQLLSEGTVVATRNLRKGLRTVAYAGGGADTGFSDILTVNGKRFPAKIAFFDPDELFSFPENHVYLKSLLSTAKHAGINTLLIPASAAPADHQLYDLCDSMGLIVYQGVCPGGQSGMPQHTSAVHTDICRSSMIEQYMHHSCIAAVFEDRHETGRLGPTRTDGGNSFAASMPLFDAVVLDASAVADLLASPHGPGKDTGAVKKEHDQTDHTPATFLASMQVPPSLPSLYTLRRYPDIAGSDGAWAIGDLAEGQQDDFDHMRRATERYFATPTDLEDWVYYSQVVQAQYFDDMIENEILHGDGDTLNVYCRLDDPRPAISRAAVDFAGIPKALMYAVQRSLKAVGLAADRDGDKIRIFAVNREEHAVEGILQLDVLHVEGKVLYSHENHVRLRHGERERVFQTSLEKVLKRVSRDEVYVRMQLLQDKTVIAENRFFFVPYKELKMSDPQLRTDLREGEGTSTVHVQAEHLAAFVYLSCRESKAVFSDNFFFLDPGAARTVTVDGLDTETLKRCLEVRYITNH